MSYRTYQSATNRIMKDAKRKGYQTEINHDKIISHYDPFNSPNIMRILDNQKDSKKLLCQKVLFEDDEDSENILTPLSTNYQENLQNSSSVFKEKNTNVVLNKIFNQNKQKVNQTALIQNKENNLQPSDFFSFNQKRRVRHPETPNFKEHLQSPLPKFMKTFNAKVQDLKNLIKKKIPINPIDFDSYPNKDLSYKLFICMSESLKKYQAVSQCRALYKISLYQQPFDQTTWEWAIKYEEQLGEFDRAYLLAKTGFMFTYSESIALKYIKLGERCQKPLDQIRGIISFLGGKIQKFSKICFQLAKLEWKSGRKQTAFKVFYFLTKQSENPMNFVYDIAKFLESNNHLEQALQILLTSIQRNIKIFIIYSYYLKLVQQVYPQLLHDSIQFVLQKSEENLPSQVRWKLNLEISQIYLRYMQLDFSKKNLKISLETSPVQSKIKPYLTILKLLKKVPPMIKNSIIIVEINKNRFINAQQPVIYNFSQWKHYLHYSLFYLFGNSINSRKQLQQAANKWNYAGRLWAQILWMQRAKGEDILQKWIKTIMEVPKSGEVWCQGGRIYSDLGDYKKAQFCFQAAMHLTPQYGDSFIEELKLLMLLGRYKDIKNLKKKMLYAQPFYGNIWCFLKSHNKSTVIDIWKRAKAELKLQLYKNNIEYMEINSNIKKLHLTALDSYNRLFHPSYVISEAQRDKIIFAYDQLENNKA